MPLFVYQGRDSDRGLELRKQHRESHIAHLGRLDDAGKIRFAGPLIDAQQNPCGSLIVFEAESLQAAQKIAESDPFLATCSHHAGIGGLRAKHRHAEHQCCRQTRFRQVGHFPGQREKSGLLRRGKLPFIG